MGVFSVWVYTPVTGIDERRAEALVACRGDWVCSSALVASGIAAGRSVRAMRSYGHLVYVEVDEDEYRKVEKIGKLLAMIAPTKLWHGLATDPDVLRGIARLLRAMVLLSAGYDESGASIKSIDDLISAASRLADIVSGLHAAAGRAQPGFIHGDATVLGRFIDYNIDVDEKTFRLRIRMNPQIRPSVVVEGARGDIRYTVKAGVLKDRPVILEIDVQANRDTEPAALADVLRAAIRAAITRVAAGAREAEPPPGSSVKVLATERVPVPGPKPDDHIIEMLRVWEMLGVPLYLYVYGKVPKMDYPAAIPSEENYWIEYDVTVPESVGTTRMHVILGGGRRVDIDYVHAVTRLPVDELIVSDEYQNGLEAELIASSARIGRNRLHNVHISAASDWLNALQYFALAVFHDIGWLDRYKPRGTLTLRARLNDVEANAVKKGNYWEVVFKPPGRRPLKQAMASAREIIRRLAELAGAQPQPA